MITIFKADEILHSVDVDAPNKKQRRILKHELFIERMWRLFSTHSQTIIIIIPFHNTDHSRIYCHFISYFLGPRARRDRIRDAHPMSVHRRPSNTNDVMDGDVGAGLATPHTGLEASRAPYSKSHARRLKRKEKEQLAGDFGTLQAALPSIAPTVATAATTRASEWSAGKIDVAAATVITTATATRPVASASAKHLVDISKSTISIPNAPGEGAAAPQPATRRGQIGEGKGTPLTKSQRRRALYATLLLSSIVLDPQLKRRFFFLFKKTFLLRRKLERFRQPLIHSNPEFNANPFETIRTHARHTLIPH
jgi:ribosome biogenesis protein SLX9